ncbi:MAG: hypothetical protein CMJ59_07455 [Planctomycetaceae bacterium]|nr:hypothetical protein [Planctomycetaceae bacterium]
MGWEVVAKLDDLKDGRLVIRRDHLQILLIKLQDQVFAIDNRCPHEGYPLAEGTCDDFQKEITCNWHNWKFRLSDGECLLGGDHVRSFPVKVEQGAVWVDLDWPPLPIREARILVGLQRAFEKRDTGRICRELTRLQFHQLDPIQAVRRSVAWSHDRLEFGTSHAFAAAADWMALSQRHTNDWERRVVCLAEAIDHMAHDTLRRPQYAYAEAGRSFSESAFLEAVEQERVDTAEALVRRGLVDGLHFDRMEYCLSVAALRHYNDFGHSLIYVQKTGELIGQLGAACEQWLLPALARHLCYATREDLIPEFNGYAAALAETPAAGGEAVERPAMSGLQSGGIRAALSWVTASLAGHRVESVFDALLQANARNQVCFDTSYQDSFERPVNDSVGWLSFTHALTFSQAVAEQCHKFPDQWPQGLLQMACFVGRNQRFLDPQIDLAHWRVAEAEPFLAEVRERLLDHGMRDPIFSAHLVKTTMAVERLVPHCHADTAEWLLAALHRFLEAPLKQKHVRRLARQAIDLVGRDFPDRAGST